MKTALRQFSVGAFTAVLLVLAGCSTPEPKLPQVRMETASYTVIFGDGVTRLSPQEKDSLAIFASTIPPSAVSSASLAADDMIPRAVARARSVRDYLIRRGFAKDAIRLAPTPGIDAHTVVITVQYAKAVPPQHCPDWSKNATANYENTDASGLGCAYYNNFIVQLANPADYNGAHATPRSDAARDSVVIQRYLADSPQPSSSTGSSSSGSTGASASSGASGAGGGAGAATASSP